MNIKDSKIKNQKELHFSNFTHDFQIKQWTILQILFSTYMKIVPKYWILALDYLHDIMDTEHSFNSISTQAIKVAYWN